MSKNLVDFQFLSTLQKKKNFCTSVHDNLSITISEASLTESYIYIHVRCQNTYVINIDWFSRSCNMSW